MYGHGGMAVHGAGGMYGANIHHQMGMMGTMGLDPTMGLGMINPNFFYFVGTSLSLQSRLDSLSD